MNRRDQVCMVGGEYWERQQESWVHLWKGLKAYSGNSQESIRVTLAKTPSIGGHRVWTSQFLYRGKAFSGGIETLAQTQNLQLTICPAYCMCWGKDGAEIVGVANQWLVQLEIRDMRGNPHLLLPRGSEPRGWIVRRPRIDPNRTIWGKKIDRLIPNEIRLYL